MCVNFVIFQLNAKNSWCAICDAYMKILSRLPNVVSSRKITCNAAWISMCLIHTSLSLINIVSYFLPARRRPQGIVIIGVCLSVSLSVCLSVCVCALFLSARYLKNGFMDHHQIWWVGAGGEPQEQVWFWCWSDSGCVSRITFPFPVNLQHWGSACFSFLAVLLQPTRRFCVSLSAF